MQIQHIYINVCSFYIYMYKNILYHKNKTNNQTLVFFSILYIFYN